MKAKTHFFSFLVFIFFLQTVLVSTATAATRIMPLGDSITQGYASGEPDEDRQVSYRKALWEKLLSAGYDIDFVGSLNSGSTLFADGDHEGHPGWTADEIVNGTGDPAEGTLEEWLADHQPDIVLLHIGTNGLDPSQNDVAQILDVIDDNSLDTWVVLALIVNRACCIEDPLCLQECQDTTDFNENVYDMAVARSLDKIIIVDMENDAEIDYRYEPTGDMFDDGVGGLHPFETGYAKMADVWFSALEEILPLADFTADPISGVHPLTVNFTDQSTGNITSWSWDFGDGSTSTSTDQNPTYIYNNAGTYTVSLTVTGPDGTDIATKDDYIVIDPVANFTADPMSGAYPLTVEFTDQSTGNITSWSWDFGDGSTSTSADQNPTYIYNNAGTYTVSLTVTGPGGTDTETKTDYITVINSTDGGGGCFISTATHGLCMGPHVKVPQEFRDYFLHGTFVGRTFVDLYHNIRHLRLISTVRRLYKVRY